MDAIEGIQVLRQRYDHSINVGFTGSRKGMTLSQWKMFEHHFKSLCHDRKVQWHDGDCLGADNQAHKVVEKIFEKEKVVGTTIGHPCNIAHQRAYNDFDTTRLIYPPLVRNRHIVNASNVMFAAPYEYEEQLRGSGTWATIRYTRRKNVRLIIIWPNGSTDLENV